MSELKKNKEYQQLVEKIGTVYQSAKTEIVTAVNSKMLNAYWEIRKYIVEFEQGGKLKAQYGKALLVNLSKDLSIRHGRGFSRSNLSYMRLLYGKYPKCEMLSHKLGWSHYFELLKVDDGLARAFYEQQSIAENWTVNELKRQKNRAYFIDCQ